MAVTSSVTVEFKIQCDTAGELLSVELDAELNMNRSCFLYGEKVYFRVYHSPALTITVISSNGSVFLESLGVSSDEEENVSFADTNEGSVSKAIAVLYSYSWFGRSLGAIVKTGWTSIRAALSGVAIAKVAYTTQYDVYSLILSDKGIESYPVLVLVTGNG